MLIIADDLGCEDSGPYGCKGVRTPNLDRLAREGMRFTHAYNTCSSCSPSRSSIITGRYPHSTGAERCTCRCPGNKSRSPRSSRPPVTGRPPPASGIWAPTSPTASTWSTRPTRPCPGRKRDGSGCTKWISTLQERPRDKPFFFWLGSIDPHRPYFEGTLDVPHKPDDTWVPPFLPDVKPTRKDLAMYYDEIDRLDMYIGKVLAELERQGVLDQTAIFFITDNGRPFPRCKTSVYDSGIRSPFLVRWPGHVKAGSTCASLVNSVDIAPTLLELAGLPAVPTFQGKSFARLLTIPRPAFAITSSPSTTGTITPRANAPRATRASNTSATPGPICPARRPPTPSAASLSRKCGACAMPAN